MNPRFAQQVAAKAQQMHDFACYCSIFPEQHTKRDCGAYWHRQVWHGGATKPDCAPCADMPLPRS